MDAAAKDRSRKPARRWRDWTPMGLTLGVWLCALPFVFLVIAPWLGARVAVVTALALLAAIAVACWAFCARNRMPGDPATGGAKRWQ